MRAAAAVLVILTAAAQTAPSPITVRIGVLSGGSYSISTLPLETYVGRVLAGEAAPNTAPAALDALAIAVRTYTLANLGRHGADGFDLCDQTHCQVMRVATADADRSAQATAGQVLLRDGAPATIFYSASCGGRTEIPSAVWPGAADPPHLPSRDDDACGGTPVWSAELAAADLQRSLAAAGFRGTLRNVRIASRNGSGRVAQLGLDGMTPARISGQDLRVVVGRTLGWQRILSTAFELRRIGSVYRFTGRGSGHGVGLCVIGSMRLAEAGQTAAAILAQYYPGLRIGPFAPRSTAAPSLPAPPVPSRPVPVPVATRSGVVVELPEGDEEERTALTAAAARARDDLAATLGVPPPAPVTLRFHPTTDEYERATNAPWFTSASAVNGELHFLPLAVLRDRGVLERTLRRALAHLMIDQALADRPMWVREGAALFYTETPAPSGSAPPRVICPGDLELQRPVSAGALADAYARARSCFARQIASGRSWREVR